MKTARLIRVETGHAGTFGLFVTAGGWWYTLECPDRDNLVNISRIPAGEYQAVMSWSDNFAQELYMLEGVPGRTGIRIHEANRSGDKALGYNSELKGCIALGNGIGRVGGQPGVAASSDALEAFHKIMGGWPFKLIVQEGIKAGIPPA